MLVLSVALRKESVDRNLWWGVRKAVGSLSLSARRAWIEIAVMELIPLSDPVALRKESVDRNSVCNIVSASMRVSLSARRAWIEIALVVSACNFSSCRSPQGERG